MRIYLLSDLHLEFEPFEPPVMDADVVVLAGDIHMKGRCVDWAVEVFSCPVLYIPGNHEYCSGHLFLRTFLHTLDRLATIAIAGPSVS